MRFFRTLMFGALAGLTAPLLPVELGAQAPAHMPEQAVYASALKGYPRPIFLRAHTGGSSGCAFQGQPYSCRPPIKVIAPVAEAIADFKATNTTDLAFDSTWTWPDSVRLAGRHLPETHSRCFTTPVTTLSRIGFSRDSSYAVVSIETVVGPGPYPGCGYVTEDVLALHRTASGRWAVIQLIGMSIT